MNCHRRSTVAPSPFARKPLAIFTALVSLGLPLTAVCADEEEQPSGATANAAPLEVGSTVVTASGFSQDVRDAPASISVITREELENKQFRSLADAVRNVEGVSIIGGDQGEISIRGMESSHVLILIDGRRQNTSQVTLKGGTSEGLGMNWIPPVEAIDRIEVVRGPMSTLYGSEALGGVINVITRKVARQWSGSVSADHTFQDSSKAGDSTQLDGYVSGPLVEDRLGIQLWGYDKQRDEDKILNGFSKSTRHSGTARLWLTPDEQQEFMLEAGRTEQEFW
ncbi:MAG: TonB-dependent receptor plug domain-containing protein, partial [Pseudomonas sp.]|nr:TonB-dependent receptor plug domain-containing protein [Pseudomonas sp.]